MTQASTDEWQCESFRRNHSQGDVQVEHRWQTNQRRQTDRKTFIKCIIQTPREPPPPQSNTGEECDKNNRADETSLFGPNCEDEISVGLR